MLGEDQLGTLELGAGAIAVTDPGPVPGYEAETAPVFRTATIPNIPRTFVVPASDRYADLAGRVGGIPAGSMLDFSVDWRAWLQGDVVIKSNWMNALGDRVEDGQIVENTPPEVPGGNVRLERGSAECGGDGAGAKPASERGERRRSACFAYEVIRFLKKSEFLRAPWL